MYDSISTRCMQFGTKYSCGIPKLCTVQHSYFLRKHEETLLVIFFFLFPLFGTFFNSILFGLNSVYADSIISMRWIEFREWEIPNGLTDDIDWINWVYNWFLSIDSETFSKALSWSLCNFAVQYRRLQFPKSGLHRAFTPIVAGLKWIVSFTTIAASSIFFHVSLPRAVHYWPASNLMRAFAKPHILKIRVLNSTFSNSFLGKITSFHLENPSWSRFYSRFLW